MESCLKVHLNIMHLQKTEFYCLYNIKVNVLATLLMKTLLRQNLTELCCVGDFEYSHTCGFLKHLLCEHSLTLSHSQDSSD